MNNNYTDDFDDIDNDLDEEPDEEFDDSGIETFSERMTRHNTDISKLRREYKQFSGWFNGMITEIGAECRHKAFICRALTNYINSHTKDSDTAKMWCVCISEHSDFIFENPADVEEEYALYNFMALADDIDSIMKRLETEDTYAEEFRRLSENITFGEKPCFEYNFEPFFDAFVSTADPDDTALTDNLKFAADRIIRSPELSKIMPVVFYALFMRYSSKMYKTEGFEPNFSKLLRYKEYIIDKDNGKNIANFYQYTNLYNVLRSQFDCCNGMLCDAGFAAISNITKCELIMWEDYPAIVRPIEVETACGYFSCFPGGYNDNPYFSANDININYIDSYYNYDNALPKKCRVIENAEKYISEHEEISERYLKLIQNSETEYCMPLIMDIINDSEINPGFIKPGHVGLAYTEIMNCVMEDISRRAKAGLISVIGKLKE